MGITSAQSYMYVPFQDNQFDPFIIWLIPNPLWVLLLFAAEADVYIQNSSTTGPTFPVSVVDFSYCAIYSAATDSDKIRTSGGKKSVLFSAALSLCRRPETLSKTLRSAFKFRFLLSKKFVVGKTPEEGLYSCFYGMINSNSQNFLSRVLKELIEHKTVNKVWCNS